MTTKRKSFTSAIFIQKVTCSLNTKKTKLKHITIPCSESTRLSSSFKAVFINEKAFPSSRLFNSQKIYTEPMLKCSLLAEVSHDEAKMRERRERPLLAGKLKCKCKRHLAFFRFFSGDLFGTFLVMLA